MGKETQEETAEGFREERRAGGVNGDRTGAVFCLWRCLRFMGQFDNTLDAALGLQQDQNNRGSKAREGVRW